MDQGLIQIPLTQKLEIELAKVNNDRMPMAEIRNYLLDAAQNNDVLHAMLMTENRTLAKCAIYVEKEVRQALNNRNGYLPDAEVYGMAEDFYYLSDEAIQELIDPPKPPTGNLIAPTVYADPPKKKVAPDPQLSLFDDLGEVTDAKADESSNDQTEGSDPTDSDTNDANAKDKDQIGHDKEMITDVK